MTLPPRALRRFGSGAFRGTIVPSSMPTADERFAAPEPFTKDAANTVRPVHVTEFSAGNRVRRGIVGMMLEWWWYRRPMSGQVFVATGYGGPDTAQGRRRPVVRAMARPRRLEKVVYNRRTFYQAPEYGPQNVEEPPIGGNPPPNPDVEGFQAPIFVPVRRMMGGRFRR